MPNADCTDGGRLSKLLVSAPLPFTDGKKATTATVSASVDSAQPRRDFHSILIVCRTSSSTWLLLVPVEEELLEVWLLGGDADHLVARDRLDHGVHLAVNGEAGELAANVECVHTGEALEIVCADRRRERHRDLVGRGALEVLDPLDGQQLALADHRHAVGHVLELGQDVR